MLSGVAGQQKQRIFLVEEDWKVPPKRVKAPYSKGRSDSTDTRVGPDTWNPV